MAFKNLIILAALMPLMIGSAMPMSHHSTTLSLRAAEQGSDGASASARIPGVQGNADDSTTDQLPQVASKNVLKETADRAPESPAMPPLDGKAPPEGDQSPQTAASSKTQRQNTPTTPPSSSNTTVSPSNPESRPSKKPISAASYLHSTKLQLLSYWSAVSLLAFIA